MDQSAGVKALEDLFKEDGFYVPAYKRTKVVNKSSCEPLEKLFRNSGIADWISKAKAVKYKRVFKTLIDEGFEHIATPVCRETGQWKLTKVNESLLYSDHRSWVYCIVQWVDDVPVVVKLGETGVLLGLKTLKGTLKASTSNRFGRLCNQKQTDSESDTDNYIRNMLEFFVKQGNIELYARKLDIIEREECVGGIKRIVRAAIHKNVEEHYLDYIVDKTGKLPRLNKARK
tara:strand:+ start:66 stop:755 length:690 start_codon:yes stop_codon:yes gene_type:complete